MGPTDPLVPPPPQGSYAYPVYAHPMHPPRGIQPPTAAPPQSWQAPNAIAPQQTHMAPPQPPSGMLPRPTQPYRDGPWVTGFEQPPPHMVAGPSSAPYPYRYRDEQTDWPPAPPGDYTYDPATVSSAAESPLPRRLTCPCSMSNLMSKLLISMNQVLQPLVHLMHLLTIAVEKKSAVGSEIGARQACNVLPHSHALRLQ